MSARSRSRDWVAGPIVQTIFVRRVKSVRICLRGLDARSEASAVEESCQDGLRPLPLSIGGEGSQHTGKRRRESARRQVA